HYQEPMTLPLDAPVSVFPANQVGHFEAFWRIYPSRAPHTNPRKPAQSKFNAIVKRGIAPETLIAGAERYARYCQTHVRDPHHIKQAITWWNKECGTEGHEPQQRPLQVGML